MSRLQAIRFCWFLGFIILPSLLVFCRKRQVETAQLELLGHLTAQQAMTLSTPVFQALLPGQGDLLLSAEPHEIPHDKFHPRIWSVDCIANEGADTVHLLRDADSGEIILVACDLHREATVPVAVLETAADATARGRTWLSRLGYHTAWHLIGVPRHRGRVWIMVLAADHRQAIVDIDAEQGNLMRATIRVF